MKPRFFFPALGLVAMLVAVSCAPAVTSPPAAPTVEAVPATAATSRGPSLEATDPATVSLASGQLQLVEFFRFT